MLKRRRFIARAAHNGRRCADKCHETYADAATTRNAIDSGRFLIAIHPSLRGRAGHHVLSHRFPLTSVSCAHFAAETRVFFLFLVPSRVCLCVLKNGNVFILFRCLKDAPPSHSRDERVPSRDSLERRIFHRKMRSSGICPFF